MKKMLYSTMLLVALMGAYQTMQSTGYQGGGVYAPKSTWLGGDTDSWTPVAKMESYHPDSRGPVAKMASSHFDSRAKVQPKGGKIAYEQMQPAEKVEMFKQTVSELKEAVAELKSQGKTLPPSANTQIKRAVERADAAHVHLLSQVRPSEVKALKTARTIVPVTATPSEKSDYRLESLSDMADNISQTAPVRFNTTVNDALNKAQIHAEKALAAVKKVIA